MWGIPYKIVSKKIRCPTMLSTLKKEDGTFTESWEESAETLLNVLLPPDKLEGETVEQRNIREEMIQEYQIEEEREIEEFTEEEVYESMREMKRKKAPGPDNIHVEILQALSEQIIPVLTSLYNECLRQRRFPNNFKQAEVIIIHKGEDKDPALPKSYRPVCLLNTMGKLQEKLLCKKLNQIRTEIGLHPGQYGFRKGRSTEDAINKVFEIVNESIKKYVLMIFIDVSGAFDNLWWPSFFERLRRMRCPKNLYGSLRNYCQDRYASLSCPTGKKTKHITKGCPQGSVCGPMFWDVMLEELLEQLTIDPEVLGSIAYADDLLLIIDANSRRELENKSNEVLIRVNDWMNKVKLTISDSKTTYSLIKGNLERDPIIKIRGKTIKRKMETRYLGIIIDEQKLFTKHMNCVCEKATKIMHSIASLAQKEYRISFRQMRIYLSTILASIVGYGSSVWAHRLINKKNAEKLNRAQRGFLVRMTGAFGTTATQALTVLTGVMPMHLETQKRACNYWLKKEKYEKIIQIIGLDIRNKRELKEIINRKRQNEWENSTKSRRLYNFIPILENIPNYFNPKQGLVHFLTGHGPYPTYLERFNLKDDAYCECGELGTPEHIVLHCENTIENEEHREMRRRLERIEIRDILQNEEYFGILNNLTEIISKKQQEIYNNRRRQPIIQP